MGASMGSNIAPVFAPIGKQCGETRVTPALSVGSSPEVRRSVGAPGRTRSWWRRRPGALARAKSALTACRLTTLVGAVLGALSCGGAPELNVVLISLGALRPDHLGCYGYSRDTSPAIDRLARKGWIFLNALSHAPSALSSHASLMTSLYPSAHGAEFSSHHPLAEEWPTMAEVLVREGYGTAAFVGPGQLSRVFALDQGFEVYDDTAEGVQLISAKAVAWLDSVCTRCEPFFLFVYCPDVQAPYSSPKQFSEAFLIDDESELPDTLSVALLDSISSRGAGTEDDRQHIVNLYDATIRFTDHFVGEFLNYLEDHGLFSRTLVVLLSGHGEELGEHGRLGMHGHTLYDELLRVPLVMVIPHATSAGQIVPEMVRLVDVAPTILDVLGVVPPPTMVGRSLIPFLGEGPLPGEEYSIAEMEPGASREGRVSCIRTSRHKLVHGQGEPQPMLFDLLHDPSESQDVAPSKPEIVARLLGVLQAQQREARLHRSEVAAGDTAAAEAELRRQLKALGYLE